MNKKSTSNTNTTCQLPFTAADTELSCKAYGIGLIISGTNPELNNRTLSPALKSNILAALGKALGIPGNHIHIKETIAALDDSQKLMNETERFECRKAFENIPIDVSHVSPIGRYVILVAIDEAYIEPDQEFNVAFEVHKLIWEHIQSDLSISSTLLDKNDMNF